MSTQPKTLVTPEQYLEIERRAEYKSEYYAGEMFAMAGAGWTHNRIVANATVPCHSTAPARSLSEIDSTVCRYRRSEMPTRS